MVPGSLSDKLLDSLSVEPVEVGDGFNILAFEVGEQAVDIVVAVSTLLGGIEGSGKGFEEALQAWQDATHQAQGTSVSLSNSSSRS